jgi:hypothetical protein
MTAARSPAAEYLRFLTWAVGVGAALALLGYAPTRRLGGEDALPLQGMLISMLTRLAAVLALGLAVGLAGWFETRPLLLWIGLGYVAQLALDVWYVVRGF